MTESISFSSSCAEVRDLWACCLPPVSVSPSRSPPSHAFASDRDTDWRFLYAHVCPDRCSWKTLTVHEPLATSQQPPGSLSPARCSAVYSTLDFVSFCVSWSVSACVSSVLMPMSPAVSLLSSDLRKTRTRSLHLDSVQISVQL